MREERERHGKGDERPGAARLRSEARAWCLLALALHSRGQAIPELRVEDTLAVEAEATGKRSKLLEICQGKLGVVDELEAKAFEREFVLPDGQVAPHLGDRGCIEKW